MSPRLIYPQVPWQNGSAKRRLSRMDFLYSDWEQHLDHPKQTLAWRLCLSQQNGRTLGIYAEGLYDAVQGQGLTKASLNYLCLGGLNKPVNWEGLGELRIWNFWDLVDHVIAQKELELKMEASACLSAQRIQGSGQPHPEPHVHSRGIPGWGAAWRTLRWCRCEGQHPLGWPMRLQHTALVDWGGTGGRLPPPFMAWSPLQSPLHSVSPQCPLQSPVRSVSPQSLLQSPLRSVSPQSLLQSLKVQGSRFVYSSHNKLYRV